ncbi:DedA family protein [Thiospirillum jenense]|uniref:DedA family protein n=1 Tax=Thiospirillum jenense TaxID=1653858 RepID=A0A839HF45_9GAMM|nr:DedA family protein [Thiospirillum jenense]MBB1127094.1 DedA family protein [Thiospirillum jenense]
MLHDWINWIVATVNGWGYSGIFILMALESTVLPVPSELVLIPAGYLAHRGDMNVVLILAASTIGSVAGAFINYYAALWIGRPVLERYGRYFFVRPALLHKTDQFFMRHGAISTFTGRLIPGIRHLISLPAGLCRMPIAVFAFYTSLGAVLWSMVLIALGYFIGNNEAVLRDHLPVVTLVTVISVGVMLTAYILWQRRRATVE